MGKVHFFLCFCHFKREPGDFNGLYVSYLDWKFMPCLINTQQKEPNKKSLKILMDNVFNVDVAHSIVIGLKRFLNNATSVGLLLIPISFRTQECSVTYYFGLFSVIETKIKL